MTELNEKTGKQEPCEKCGGAPSCPRRQGEKPQELKCIDTADAHRLLDAVLDYVKRGAPGTPPEQIDDLLEKVDAIMDALDETSEQRQEETFSKHCAGGAE